MIAQELIAHLRDCGPQPLNVIFHFLADRCAQSRLASGARLCDAGDFTAWLRELGDAAQPDIPGSTEALHLAERSTRPTVTGQLSGQLSEMRNWNTCPRCGHVHEGDRECGAEVGRGQLCRCEMEVPV